MLSAPIQEKRGAVLSQDRAYRYRLWRRWGPGPMTLWVGLNPSTANERDDDPTVRRMLDFSRRFGAGALTICNLFGLVSPQPEILLSHPDPVGDNDAHLVTMADKADTIILCWGAFTAAQGRDKDVLALLQGRPLHCMGKTLTGAPRHPLYLPKTTKMEVWP